VGERAAVPMIAANIVAYPGFVEFTLWWYDNVQPQVEGKSWSDPICPADSLRGVAHAIT
jgi:hypothetical protein